MKTEKKVEKFLTIYYSKSLICQFKPDWIKNPVSGRMLSFDFCIENIIIELDGDHHFEINTRPGTNYNQNRQRDIYKMKKAIEHEYSIIRIYQPDVWNDIYDWKNKLLNNIIILQKLTKNILYMTYSTIYNRHIKDYNNYNINQLIRCLETYENYENYEFCEYSCKYCGSHKYYNFYKNDRDVCKVCKDNIAFENLFNKLYIKK